MFLVDVATNTSSITAAEFAQRVADAVVVLINSVSRYYSSNCNAVTFGISSLVDRRQFYSIIKN